MKQHVSNRKTASMDKYYNRDDGVFHKNGIPNVHIQNWNSYNPLDFTPHLLRLEAMHDVSMKGISGTFCSWRRLNAAGEWK